MMAWLYLRSPWSHLFLKLKRPGALCPSPRCSGGCVVTDGNPDRGVDQTRPQQKRRKKKRPSALSNEHLSWEERLADAVTPLWRLSYEDQLRVKYEAQRTVLLRLSAQLAQGADPLSPLPWTSGQLGFPLLPILPSPVTDGYRNKSTFSVNRGPDGNPKTVGFYVGTGKARDIVCVRGDHLQNMPAKHKLVARCYEEFIRLSPLEPCLLFHEGGHWREITVRTNAAGSTMAIVYFHPQRLTQEEVCAHKAALTDYFARGPGKVCQLDSLYFQESSGTRCSHEDSPYQLLRGEPHIYEELLGLSFRISADAFFQVNTGGAEVLYRAVGERGFAEGAGTLLDVCCGTGALGLSLSRRARKVVGIEVVEQAVRDARHNAALNGVPNCRFLPGKAEEVLPGLVPSLGSEPDLLAVVNPSRAGLHYRVTRALRNCTALRRLVYVSCKPEGEAMRNFRDLCCPPDGQKKLTGHPFVPTSATPVDMFPHTAHCELLLVFER
nr:PREDICTED: tRNA (uracil(54)-C(5))-methyltransferase homolog [Lepisosteus oculatus]